MKGTNAPVILFVYNRPQHTLQTLEALNANTVAADTDLIVFADGPKPGATEREVKLIDETRDVVRSRQWCRSVVIAESVSNKGLATSVIDGTYAVLKNHDRVITLEDDVIVGKYFLEYMNTALEKYKNEEDVYMVAGYIFPVKKIKASGRSFFMPLTSTQAWGTWRRAWEQFDEKAIGYESLKTNEQLRSAFNLNNSFDYTSMLIMQMESDKISSWAIRWWWTVFNKKGLVLFPDKSMVRNIGWDNSGTHSGAENPFEETNWDINYNISKYPDSIQVHHKNFFELQKYLSGLFQSKKSSHLIQFWNRLKNKIKSNSAKFI